MKKLFTTFFLAFTLFTSNLCALSGPEIPADKFVIDTENIYSREGYMHYKNCKYINRSLDDDDEFLYASDTIFGNSYEAGDDSLECEGSLAICILGYSTVRYTAIYNNCWNSVLDTWNDKWESSSTIKLSECDTTLGPWTKRTSKKIPVFVTTDNRIKQAQRLSSEAPPILVKSIIGNKGFTDNTGSNLLKDNDVQCVAYICDAGDGKYSYGCADGSCADPCPEPAPEPDPAPIPGPEPGNTTPVHRNTVKPYLDALKQKYGIK